MPINERRLNKAGAITALEEYIGAICIALFDAEKAAENQALSKATDAVGAIPAGVQSLVYYGNGAKRKGMR